MAPRKRFGIPTAADAAIGARLKQVRVQCRFSRPELAPQIGLTADQIKRAENGTVSLRFGPAWRFCELTRTNPLWLAFGDLYPRVGFASLPSEQINPREPDLFQNIMGEWAIGYARYRVARLKISKSQQEGFAQSRLEKTNLLAEPGVKRYLADQMTTVAGMTWNNLRTRLKAATRTPGARVKLARVFGVSTAAVSQWLSGASAPKADTTLRLLKWVTVAEAKQKKSAGSVPEARPALKTRARRSKQ